MSANQLLDRIEKQGLLEEKVLASLRQQVAQKDVAPEVVLKTLMSKGLLTKFQVKKLQEEIAAEPPQDDGEIVDLAPLVPVSDDSHDLSPQMDDDELAPLGDDDELAPISDSGELSPLADEDTLAPLNEQPAGLQPIDDSGLAPLGDGGGLEPLGGGGGLEPLGGDTGGLQPLGGGGLEPLGGGGLAPLGDGGLAPLGDGGLAPLGDGGLTPLGDGGGANAMGAADAATGVAQQPDPNAAQQASGNKYKAPKKDSNKISVWDSKLLLFGGFTLVALLIGAIVMIVNLGGEPAQALFNNAEKAYLDQQFGQAINDYKLYLQKHSKEKDADMARAKIHGAELWQLANVRDPARSVSEAERILLAAKTEKEFSKIRQDIASILPRIAQGAAQVADNAGEVEAKREKIKIAEQAMVLIENPEYIPSSLRQGIARKIAEIEEIIGKVHRDIGRSDDLTKAIADIGKASDNGDTAAARDIQITLLKRFPGLRNDEKLVEALEKVGQVQIGKVTVSQKEILAVREDHKAVPGSRITLALRTGKKAEGIPNLSTLVLARGTVYSLDVSTGDIRWTRFVGYDTELSPIMLSQQTGGDALLIDGARHELLRVKADSGELVWRYSIGEPFFEPVLADDKILVATPAGALIQIDTQSGASTKQVKFPQPLATGPCLSNNYNMLYQVADHSNVYILDRSTLKCTGLYYLGHSPGAVVGRPAMTQQFLFVPVNTSSNTSQIKLLKAQDSEGTTLKALETAKRLNGQVNVPLQLSNRRIIVLTDLGGIEVYEIDPSKEKENDPVQPAVSPYVATATEAHTHFAKIDAGGLIWVASNHVARHEVQFAQGQFSTKWDKMKGDHFVGNIQLIRNVLVMTRRVRGGSGIIAFAMDALDGERIWETQLSCAPIQLIPEEDKVIVISSNGSYYELDDKLLNEGGILNEPTASPLLATPTAFQDGVNLGNGRWAFTSRTTRGQLLYYDPTQIATRIRTVSLGTSGQNARQVTAPPTAFGDGMLIPVDIGQVQLLNSKASLKPFQPQLQSGVKLEWRKPAVIADGTEFVIADGRKHLYRVGVRKTPAPFLSGLAYVELESDIVSPLAAVGDTLYGVTRSGSIDSVSAFGLPDLSAGKTWPLGGRVLLGPKKIGERIYIVSSAEGLLCFEAGQKKAWESKSENGTIVNVSELNAGSLLVTSQEGYVWTVQTDTGQAGKGGNVNQPLGPGAIIHDGKMLLPGTDGTVHVIPMGGGS